MSYKQLISQGVDENNIHRVTVENISPVREDMTFVLATDTHSQDVSAYPDGADKNIYGGFTKQYADMCSIVSKIQPDFYGHLGDLIQDPLSLGVATAQSSLQGVARNEAGITCPKYHVTGNHDTNYAIATTLENQQFYAELNDEYINNTQGENFTGQEDVGYYHATRGDFHIFVLNTVNKDTGRTDAWYDIDSTQRAWFISELNGIADFSNILILSHTALRVNLSEYEGSTDPKDFTIVGTTITELENAMISYLTTNKNSRIIGWFGGHAHESMRQQESISTSGGQTELNYFTLARTGYSTQSQTYRRTELSFAVCTYNKDDRTLEIDGFGSQDSYSITY